MFYAMMCVLFAGNVVKYKKIKKNIKLERNELYIQPVICFFVLFLPLNVNFVISMHNLLLTFLKNTTININLLIQQFLAPFQFVSTSDVFAETSVVVACFQQSKRTFPFHCVITESKVATNRSGICWSRPADRDHGLDFRFRLWLNTATTSNRGACLIRQTFFLNSQ